MAEVSRARLIAVPALVTLAVTLLRLFGELQHWSPMLFRRDPGGLGAVVGMIWLASTSSSMLPGISRRDRPLRGAQAVVDALVEWNTSRRTTGGERSSGEAVQQSRRSLSIMEPRSSPVLG